MRFVKGVEVFNSIGEKIGTVSRVVIDAKTRDVTDLVVERDKDEKVVSIGLIDPENEERLIVREINQSVDDFPDYETTHYVSLDQAGAPYDNIQTSYLGSTGRLPIFTWRHVAGHQTENDPSNRDKYS